MNLPNDLVSMFERQATHELTAAMAYLAMAHWCQSQDFPGFAEFFTQQYQEELEHATKFHQHLLERGCNPAIGAIAAPRGDYASLQEIALTALELEQENSRGIIACHEAALHLKDYPSQSLLQWFITEQVEEEGWAQSLVTQTERLTCPGALLNLDRHIVKMIGD